MTKRISRDELATTQIAQSAGRLQRRTKERRNAFNAKRKQQFLDALALSCNVRLACAYTGISPATAHGSRQRDPIFDGQWRDALAHGLERLEALVVEHGGAGLPLEPADPERAAAAMDDPPPFDFDKAIRALQVHANLRKGAGARVVGCSHLATEADTDHAIEKLLDQMRRRALRERVPRAALPAPDSPAAEDPDEPVPVR